MWYYSSKKEDTEVIDKLIEMIEIKPHRGFDYYYHRIRKQGFIWNRKRVLRIYRLLGLTMRRKSPNEYLEDFFKGASPFEKTFCLI